MVLLLLQWRQFEICIVSTSVMFLSVSRQHWWNHYQLTFLTDLFVFFLRVRRKVQVHPGNPAVAIEANHRDSGGTAEGIFGRILVGSFDYGHLLARDYVREVQLHPGFQVSLELLDHPAASVGGSVGEDERGILREGAREDLIALSPVVLVPSGPEEASLGLCESSCFAMLKTGGFQQGLGQLDFDLVKAASHC